jgi:hypothetical protein
MDVLGLPAGGCDGSDGMASAIVEHVADYQPGTGLGHQSSGLPADATRRTGNEGNLAVETVHIVGLRFHPLAESLRSGISDGKSHLSTWRVMP